MKQIVVDDILKRNNFSSMKILENVFTTDGKGGSEGSRLRAAIKEIVEEVLNAAAENAEMRREHTLDFVENIKGEYWINPVSSLKVNKSSIINTKEQVKF